jgi:membrane associated rhomboid family serine protease
MNESAPLIVILRLVAATVPWYPKAAAESLGLGESDLIAFVEQLRQGGLIVRTDPVPGHGRGYVLTPAGAHALTDPGDLEWLRRGELPPPKTPTADGLPSPASMERERAVRMSLLAPFTARVVRLLIVVNVAVFLWGVYLAQQRGMSINAFLDPKNLPQIQEIAHLTGAVTIDDVRPPGWGLVRLLTCCFVHFGLIHIGANMLSLYFIGPLLERMWGHWRFLVLYLIAGFGGSCTAMIYKPTVQGQPVMLAGASGAIWGIMASMAIWVILNRRYLPRRLLSSWGLNIIIVFVINIALTQGIPGISGEAHYGGGIVGAACAVLLHLTRFGPVAQRWLAGGLVAALPVVGLWMVIHPPQMKGQREPSEVAPDVMPQVNALEKASRDFAPGAAADPILETPPKQRDADQVRHAIQQYGKAEKELQKAVTLLNEGAPYNDDAREDARKKRLKEIEDRLDLLKRNRERLEAGKP